MRKKFSLGGMTEAKKRFAYDLEQLTPKQKRIYQMKLDSILTDSRFDILTDDDLADYINGWYGEDVVTRLDFIGPNSFKFGFKVLALYESEKMPQFWEEKLYMEKGGSVERELMKYGHSAENSKKLIESYKNKIDFNQSPKQVAWEIDKMSNLGGKRTRFNENLD